MTGNQVRHCRWTTPISCAEFRASRQRADPDRRQHLMRTREAAVLDAHRAVLKAPSRCAAAVGAAPSGAFPRGGAACGGGRWFAVATQRTGVGRARGRKVRIDTGEAGASTPAPGSPRRRQPARSAGTTCWNRAATGTAILSGGRTCTTSPISLAPARGRCDASSTMPGWARRVLELFVDEAMRERMASANAHLLQAYRGAGAHHGPDRARVAEVIWQKPRLRGDFRIQRASAGLPAPIAFGTDSSVVSRWFTSQVGPAGCLRPVPAAGGSAGSFAIGLRGPAARRTGALVVQHVQHGAGADPGRPARRRRRSATPAPGVARAFHFADAGVTRRLVGIAGVAFQRASAVPAGRGRCRAGPGALRRTAGETEKIGMLCISRRWWEVRSPLNPGCRTGSAGPGHSRRAGPGSDSGRSGRWRRCARRPEIRSLRLQRRVSVRRWRSSRRHRAIDGKCRLEVVRQAPLRLPTRVPGDLDQRPGRRPAPHWGEDAAGAGGVVLRARFL